MMTTLSVNVNKVALLRNSRPLDYPSPVALARQALEAGAQGVTVHPRPDERHIRPADVHEIAALLAEPSHTDREFNIEGNPFEGRYLDLVRQVKPDQCTLVPDTPGQSTSDHGWRLADDMTMERLRPLVAELHDCGCRVSLFMDADVDAMVPAKKAGTDRVELYTEPFAVAFASAQEAATAPSTSDQTLEAVRERFANAAIAAQAEGLHVNAGHDLTLNNLGRFLSSVPGVVEVSIGHALIADALQRGMTGAVQAYLRAIRGASATT